MRKCRPTPHQPDLASPRGYAARLARVGYNSSSVRSKNAKPVMPPVGRPGNCQLKIFIEESISSFKWFLLFFYFFVLSKLRHNAEYRFDESKKRLLFWAAQPRV
jgi:phosphatidylserine decarboxylase